jgi:elongation factor Ts
MSIALIKKLREETGAGMLECKKALEDHQGDYKKALFDLSSLFHENIDTKRVASKGLCHIVIKDSEAILFEVNAETDFVSKNTHFVKLIHDLGDILIDSRANYPKQALEVTYGKQSVDEMIKHTASIIKENAYLRRFFRIKKDESQVFGSYIHQGGKIVTLVILNSKHETLARDLAMQVAANSPIYLSLDSIDEQTMRYERMMYEKNNHISHEALFMEHLKEMTLYEQSFIKDSTKTVKEVLLNTNTEIVDFFRFELGQGIEDKLNCKLTLPCDGSIIEITPKNV